MKKGILLTFLLVAMINFVSAQEISELLGSIDQSAMIIYGMFIIFFSLLFFALSKVIFKENRATAGIIAAVLSILIVYGINKSEFNVEEFFSDIGISEGALSLVLSIVIIAGIIFIIIKFAKNSLVIVGGLLIVGSFFVYEKIILITVGVILIVTRFFIKKGIWEMKRGRPGERDYVRGESWHS